MKISRVILILCFASNVSLAQVDSVAKIYKTTSYKKGFYKTFDEFINNAPSTTTEFTVRQKNNMGENYTFDMKDGSKVGKVYGFCDGTTVYVHGLRLEGFHKLEYIGPISFFTFGQARYSLATAMLPDHLVIIDETGVYRDGTVNFVTKFLKKMKPELGSEFESLPDKKEKRKDFIIRLNELIKTEK
jgi:uncharacterized FlgJ-related protein